MPEPVEVEIISTIYY